MRRRGTVILGVAVAAACVGAVIAGVSGFAGRSSDTARTAPVEAASPAGRHQQTASSRGGRTARQAKSYTDRPLLAVVGASFAAGVGAGHPSDAWPEDLARMLGWRLAVRADPGAGYVNPGYRNRGPFYRLAARLHLARLDPTVVLIQGGHDDMGAPLALIRSRVASLVHTILTEAPHTRLGIISVFVKPNRPPGPTAWATDAAIVTAAERADPRVIVFDPLVQDWTFPRMRRGGLHPSPRGHRLLAERIAAGLRRDLPLACPPHPSPRDPCRIAASSDEDRVDAAGAA